MVSAEMEKVSVTGSALVYAPVNQLATAIVHNVTDEADLSVTIKGPNGPVIPRISGNDVGAQIDFLPNLTGEHHIDIKYKGNPINGSPFATKIYDIKQIKVKEMPKEILIGKPVTFIVEAKNAGPGNLEIIINNGNVPSTPQALGSSQYAITFLPKEVENHQIDIRFNGELVEGAPFICSVLDLSKIVVQKDGLDKVPVNSLVTFFIETNGTVLSEKQITITGGTSKAVKFDLIEEGQVGYKVSFIPTELGDHMIDIKLGGESVSSCPFLVRVYDAKRVKVTEPSAGEIGKLLSFSIDASQAGAGNLEIIVTVNGRYVHNYVIKEGNAKFRVNFKPMEPDVHMVNVKFNGESVPGSPFMVRVIDSSQSVILGDALRMASLTKGIDFTIENKNDRIQDCVVHVTCDNGKKMVAEVKKLKGSFRVNFMPIEIGPHAITIILDGVIINGCPFNCNVYDVSKVKVSGLNTFEVGNPVTFQIDAVEAGEGTLEILVTNRKTGIRPEVDMKSRGLYDVTFVPQEKISHYIRIIFNEEDVPGSPFKIEMKDLIPKNGLVGSSNIAIIDAIEPAMEVKVVGPQKTAIVSKVTRDNSTFKVEFVPKEVGLHRIEQYVKGNLVAEKTSFIEICDPSRVKLIDVQDGVVGREQTFKIDCTWAGRGNLSVNIKTSNDAEVAHCIKEISTGVFLVSYKPKVDSPHYIDVRYNDHQAPGCPQMVEIRDPTKSIIVHGPALKSCVPEEPATFLIETGGFAAAKNFDVIVTDPNGSPLNIKCYQQKDGSLLAEFTPQRTGPHKIDVLYQDNSITGSPFTSEVFDASKVTLQRIKSTNFIVNEKIFFTLNRKDAGYAELDFTVTSPLGRHLPIEVKGTPDGEGEIIEFIPTVPGKYKIAITFGGIEIPGSPVTFIAQEGNLPVLEGNGLKLGFVDQPVEFNIDARELKGSPEVRVDGPDSEPQVEIEETNGIYRVSFVPTEVGIFDVRVLWNRKELPGSPFHPKILNLEQVRPIGGWESIFNGQEQILLTLNEKKRISFDVTGAGPGKLAGFIKFPDDKVEPAMIEQTAPHKFRLSLTPKLEGEYQIRLNFGDQRLPKSPLIGITNSVRNGEECATVVLRGQGLAGARVGEETQFILDGTDAGPGTPEITMNGVKADISIKVTQINDRIFKATYTPSIQGTYLLNVLWSGKQVKGCPLKVSILPRCDASRVLCSGEGLKGGAIDQEIKVFIDTRRAGPGDLSAHCIGPNKVAFCELLDQMDGTFNLFVKPQEPGKHLLTIKYGGENIRGSPFTLKIAGSPDASKVRVHGPGIEHGVLPLYMSRFICDTRGAGYGDLTVQIRGPRGAFRADMQRVNQNDRIILCKYDPTEPGDYTIEVKYSGKHVPGSPFTVMIFDTQDELNRFNSRQFGGNNEITKNNNNHHHHPQPTHHIRSSHAIIPSHLPHPVHSPHLVHPHPPPPPPHPPVDYLGSSMAAYSIYGPTSWRGSANEL